MSIEGYNLKTNDAGGDGGGESRIVSYMAGGMSSSSSINNSFFNSPVPLSLALKTGLEGQVDHVNVKRTVMDENHYEKIGVRRSRDQLDQEHDQCKSGSDNIELAAASGDDHDHEPADDDIRPRKKIKRYNRHTPQQIQELEAVFKECPHPDEKQRLELSKKLSLETRQVKFWFQNRRTQMKTQLERHESSILRQENDKLRAENMSIRETMRNPMCTNCGGATIFGEISMEDHHLRVENARLKDELDRVSALAAKFLGRPMSSISTLTTLSGPIVPTSIPSSALELGVGTNCFSPLPLTPDFSCNPLSVVSPTKSTANGMGLERSIEKSMYLELALGAMDELLKMAQTNEPLWLRSNEDGRKEMLNHDEYMRCFSPCIGLKNGYVTEASRETGVVELNSLALVETLMDSNRWMEMFAGIVIGTSTTDVVSSGMGGTKNGALQLMDAEFQVLSPLVAVRVVNFLRFCKQHAEGIWAIVDVSIDCMQENSISSTYVNCRRFPSGCIIQDMPNGYSKVTWVEHAEYEESGVHQLYRPLIRSGMGFGAQKWVTTLQRQSHCLSIHMSSTVPTGHLTGNAITPRGRRSMLKLAQRMTTNFCSGLCASTKAYKWSKLSTRTDDDIRVMTRKSVDEPGEPPGIVLSASTSIWLPVSPQKLFNFLRDERLRCEWDILSNGGPMQEMARIAKGHQHHHHAHNSVSLLRVSGMNSNESSMLILQETCTDASGALVVYAPVDIPAMHVVMNGGDSTYVALLPSGFAIHHGPTNIDGPGGGSLLTVGFQILVNSLPTAKLTVESVDTVNNLISCTLHKIKAALQ